MDGSFGMYGEKRGAFRILMGRHGVGDNLEDSGLYMSIILKRIFK
jgi:hypothetical protein